MSKTSSRTPSRRTPRTSRGKFPNYDELESYHPRHDIMRKKEIDDIKHKIFINKNKGLSSTPWQKDLEELEQDRVDREIIHANIMRIGKKLYGNDLKEQMTETEKEILEDKLESLKRFISTVGILRHQPDFKEFEKYLIFDELIKVRKGNPDTNTDLADEAALLERLDEYVNVEKLPGGRTKRRTFKGKKPKSKRASGSSLKKRKTKRKTKRKQRK